MKECKCSKCERGKEEKLYFCPKCKSKDVGYMMNAMNLFGIFPRMRCNECGFEAAIFPISVNKPKKINRKKRK